MSAGFLEAFYGACFALIGWLVLSIIKLTISIDRLEHSLKPLTEDIPKMKKDIDSLHQARRNPNGK